MLRDRVRPLFYTRMRLGEFDPPAMNPYSTLDLSVVQSPEHRNLSLEAAVKSFVLLKNVRGTLPLRAQDLPGKRLAVSHSGGLLAPYPGHADVPSFVWHRTVGAHCHLSALHRWWVPSPTTPGCCSGTTRQCRSRGTSTPPGETARCCRPSPGPGLLLEPPGPLLGAGVTIGASPRCPDPGAQQPSRPLLFPGAGGGWGCCWPMSASRRAATSRGARSTRPRRWPKRQGQPMWWWSAWGQVGGSGEGAGWAQPGRGEHPRAGVALGGERAPRGGRYPSGLSVGGALGGV